MRKKKQHGEGGPAPPERRPMPPDKDTILNLDESFEKKMGSLRVSDPYIGLVIGERYRLHEKIGSGGMGSVYRATHVLMDKPVAIKLISAELTHLPQVVGRFEREARSASRLNHPNCIQVTDFGRTEDGTLYLVMELLDGEPLDELLSREITLPAMRAIEFTKQILTGLQHAHDAGIVHRDLKPANVMLVKQEDGSEFAKVFDFGIAKIADGATTDNRLTQQGMIVGTPAYLSPEQALGEEADNRSDLYAVGIMLYEMLTGEVPFTGDVAVDVVSAHINANVPPLPGSQPYPVGLQRLLDRAMAKKPSDRFQSASEFLEALLPLESERLELRRPARRRIRWRWVVGTILSVAAIAAGTVFAGKYYFENLRPEEKRLTVDEDDLATDQDTALYPGISEKDVSDLLKEAEAQMQSSLYEDAIKTITKALIISPEEPIALLLMGHALFVSDKRGEAMDAYEKALETDQKLAEDERLREYLAAAFEYDGSREKAAFLFARYGGESGLKLLTDRANSKLSAHRKQRAVARKALIAIGKENAIDWPASLSADFDDYKFCKKRKQIILQMEEIRDPGFLPFLEAQVPENGRWSKALRCYKEDVERAIAYLKHIDLTKPRGTDGVPVATEEDTAEGAETDSEADE